MRARAWLHGLVAAAWLTVPALGSVVPVGDRERIRSALGTEITVEGRIANIGESETRSILFLNFESVGRGGFTVIVRQGTLAGDFHRYDADFAKRFVGKQVRVTGEVSQFQGIPQMQVFAPSQIEVLSGKRR